MGESVSLQKKRDSPEFFIRIYQQESLRAKNWAKKGVPTDFNGDTIYPSMPDGQISPTNASRRIS
jgi:hypothetical protein